MWRIIVRNDGGQEVQKRIAKVMTWWHKVQKTFATALTWWQEFKKRFAIALTWGQVFKKGFLSAPLGLLQENKGRRAPQVNHNFAVRTTLRQLKQTRFCWPSNDWRQTVIQPISTTTSLESRNCPNPSQQQCQPLTGNQRNLNCLKIFSKRVKNP